MQGFVLVYAHATTQLIPDGTAMTFTYWAALPDDRMFKVSVRSFLIDRPQLCQKGSIVEFNAGCKPLASQDLRTRSTKVRGARRGEYRHTYS